VNVCWETSAKRQVAFEGEPGKEPDEAEITRIDV